MRNRICLSVLTVGYLLSASLVYAAENPLEAIPDSATVVARLKSPEATTGKLVEFANQIEPPGRHYFRPTCLGWES